MRVRNGLSCEEPAGSLSQAGYRVFGRALYSAITLTDLPSIKVRGSLGSGPVDDFKVRAFRVRHRQSALSVLKMRRPVLILPVPADHAASLQT